MFTDIIDLCYTTVTKSESKAIKFSEKHEIRAFTPFKVILLVINSHWHPISYRFGVIAAYCSNFGHFAFLSPHLGVRDNVWYPSWAHWKAHTGLPISVNWTFFPRCYGWGATSENRLKIGATSDYLFKIGNFALTGTGWPKISGGRGRPLYLYLYLWGGRLALRPSINCGPMRNPT